MTFLLNPLSIVFTQAKSHLPNQLIPFSFEDEQDTSFFPKQLKFSFTLPISLLLTVCNEAKRQQGTCSLEILVKSVTTASEVPY